MWGWENVMWLVTLGPSYVFEIYPVWTSSLFTCMVRSARICLLSALKQSMRKQCCVDGDKMVTTGWLDITVNSSQWTVTWKHSLFNQFGYFGIVVISEFSCIVTVVIWHSWHIFVKTTAFVKLKCVGWWFFVCGECEVFSDNSCGKPVLHYKRWKNAARKIDIFRFLYTFLTMKSKEIEIWMIEKWKAYVVCSVEWYFSTWNFIQTKHYEY